MRYTFDSADAVSFPDSSDEPTNCSVSKDDDEDVTVDVVEFRENLNLSEKVVHVPLPDRATVSTERKVTSDRLVQFKKKITLNS